MSTELKQGVRSRIVSALRRELKEYGTISLYLFLYFVAIFLYRASILREEGIAFAPVGLAAIKALVIGKFVVIGKAMHLGNRSRRMPMAWHVLHQVIVFVALLFGLSSLEDGILSLIHGHTLQEAVSRFTAQNWHQIAALCLLGCLALAPLLGIDAIADALGTQNFHRLLFGKRS